MRVLVVVSFLVAAASAGFLPAAYRAALGRGAVFDENGYKIDDAPVVAPLAVAAPIAYATHVGIYAGPQHLPVIGPNGVPLDTPEVVAAKASHAASHAEAEARNAGSGGDEGIVVGAQLAGAVAIGPNGVPLETPEVAAARANHAVAHAEAAARNAAADSIAVVAPVVGVYTGPQHLPVIGPNGVPLDTPEVAAGKAANAVAHAEAKARNGDVAVVAPLTTVAGVAPLAYAGGYVAPVLTYTAPQHLPVIGPNGVPLDTPEVAAGKVANAVAHVEAKARNGDVAVVAPLTTVAGVAPLAYAGGYVAPVLTYAGPQHLPVIGPNGVPLDTPEVAAGKAFNTAAHLEAKVRNGDLVVHY